MTNWGLEAQTLYAYVFVVILQKITNFKLSKKKPPDHIDSSIVYIFH